MAIDFIKNPTPAQKRLNSKPKGYDFWKPAKTNEQILKEETEKLAKEKADFEELKAKVAEAEKDFESKKVSEVHGKKVKSK